MRCNILYSKGGVWLWVGYKEGGGGVENSPGAQGVPAPTPSTPRYLQQKTPLG